MHNVTQMCSTVLVYKQYEITSYISVDCVQCPYLLTRLTEEECVQVLKQWQAHRKALLGSVSSVLSTVKRADLTNLQGVKMSAEVSACLPAGGGVPISADISADMTTLASAVLGKTCDPAVQLVADKTMLGHMSKKFVCDGPVARQLADMLR